MSEQLERMSTADLDEWERLVGVNETGDLDAPVHFTTGDVRALLDAAKVEREIATVALLRAAELEHELAEVLGNLRVVVWAMDGLDIQVATETLHAWREYKRGVPDVEKVD